MASADVFYYVVALSFAILAVFLSWACYRTVRTLEKVDGILDEIKGMANEIEIFRSGIKIGLVSLISALVARLRVPAGKTREVKNRE